MLPERQRVGATDSPACQRYAGRGPTASTAAEYLRHNSALEYSNLPPAAARRWAPPQTMHSPSVTEVVRQVTQTNST